MLATHEDESIQCPSLSHNPYPFSSFATMLDNQHYMNNRKSLDLRPSPSNLSTASGPSAPSSTMGSTYSNHGQTFTGLKWGSTGLGINPSIVSGAYDDVTQSFNYTPADMGLELAFLDVKAPFFVDPSLIHQNTGVPAPTPVIDGEQIDFQSYHTYPLPQSPIPSNQPTNSSQPIKRSRPPYLNVYQTYPYPQRRPSPLHGSQDGSFDNGNIWEKGRCPNPECGKVFKDVKAHILTHQNERPEKCPIATCDYHVKGFARKYDKNRHTLTHYKGAMVCGFCPGSGSSAEKSFNRADVFKRHLTSIHATEQTPPNNQKKTFRGFNAGKKLTDYALDTTGKCSTCSVMFQNAQDFYEHLDDCVIHTLRQQDSSKAINAQTLAEVEN